MNSDILLALNALKFALGEAPEIIADVEALEQKIKGVAAQKAIEAKTPPLALQNGEAPVVPETVAAPVVPIDKRPGYCE